MKEDTKIIGYKAFDEKMQCRGFQYEIGKEYEESRSPSLCNHGFHFCENPLDVLNYYNLFDSKFAQVEALGETKTEGDKSATNKIRIVADIGVSGLVKASVKFLWDKCWSDPKTSILGKKKNTDNGEANSQLAASGHSSQLAASGHSSQLAASGDYSKLAASGDYSQLAASGDSSQLAASGQYSIVANIGKEGQAKGIIGSWLVLAEYNSDYQPICVRSEQVDGKKIKADVFYTLKKGKFVEVK